MKKELVYRKRNICLGVLLEKDFFMLEGRPEIGLLEKEVIGFIEKLLVIYKARGRYNRFTKDKFEFTYAEELIVKENKKDNLLNDLNGDLSLYCLSYLLYVVHQTCKLNNKNSKLKFDKCPFLTNIEKLQLDMEINFNAVTSRNIFSDEKRFFESSSKPLKSIVFLIVKELKMLSIAQADNYIASFHDFFIFLKEELLFPVKYLEKKEVDDKEELPEYLKWL